MKIRGTALHVAEKYVQLARDAQSSGDRVAGENYLQHAEHYYRIVAAAQAQMPQPQQFYRNDDGDDEGDDENAGGGYNGNQNGNGGGGNPYQQGNRQPYQGGQPGGPQQGAPQQAPNGQNVEPGPSTVWGNGNNNGGDQQGFEGQQNEPREDNSRPYNNNNQANSNQGGDRNNGNGNNFRGRRRRPLPRPVRGRRSQWQQQRAGAAGPAAVRQLRRPAGRGVAHLSYRHSGESRNPVVTLKQCDGGSSTSRRFAFLDARWTPAFAGRTGGRRCAPLKDDSKRIRAGVPYPISLPTASVPPATTFR